jgi:hypothetical protein
VEHVAVRALPLPESATAEHPEIELPPSVKLTVPVGLLPVTVAVKVTPAPTIEGFAELESEVEAVALFTICESVLLVDEALLASPT